MAVSFKGTRFPKAMLLTGVRWSGASPLSPRYVAARMRARSVPMAHAPIPRWDIKDSPQFRFTVFGFQVFYSSAKKVFHKDRRIRGGTIGGRSLFRIFICMPL